MGGHRFWKGCARLCFGMVARCAGVAGLRVEAAERWALGSVHEEVIASQRRRHLVYAALRAGRFTPLNRHPLRDASCLHARSDQEIDDVEAMAWYPRLQPRTRA